ncbi:MAG: PKD domain-containing protein [Actinobacteria bacterium]|nr:PKD domain-containing protein [Cyanobacteriota bacterium]MCL5771649.1 PKD domain-containing protein [Actinomycetota bacterium]
MTAPGSASSSSSSSSSSIPVNHPPDVADINVSSGTLYTDSVYVASAAASDSDGDALTYAWSSTGGTWINPNINPAQWKAPAAAGNYTLTLTVNDGHGGITVKTKNVNVVLLSLITLKVPAVYSEGGYIEHGGITNAGGCVYAGDSGANNYCYGFMSYDISSLAGATIDWASVTFLLKKTYGNPTEHAGSLMVVEVVNYGPTPISQSLFSISGIPIYSAAAPSFSYYGDALKTQIQNAINSGKQRFQLLVGFTSPNNDGDGVWDGWEYDQTGITLNIKYWPAH